MALRPNLFVTVYTNTLYLSIVFPVVRAGVCAVPVGGVEGGEVDIQIPA